MQRRDVISVVLALSGFIALALGGNARGGEAAKPKTVPAGLVGKALQAMDGAEEIIFAVRGLCSATQCHATFGVYSNEPKSVHAPDGARLCKLNPRTRQVTVLLDDPKGGVRDPRVHYDSGKPSVFGNGLFLASRVQSAIAIVDITDLHHPQLLSHFPTAGNPSAVVVRNEALIIPDGHNGLLVYDDFVNALDLKVDKQAFLAP